MGDTRTALITGGSAGLGRALARALAERDWRVVVTARDAERLRATAAELGPNAVAVAGDVTDPALRAEVLSRLDRLDLLVNNASELGGIRPLVDYPLDMLRRVYEVNVVAPLAFLQATLPLLRAARGAAIDIGSDAGVEAYVGWGGYGSSKAALDQLTAVLAAEHPDVPIYAVDPGEMRTTMHQEAFPGQDISDRPEPETVVPALLALLDTRLPSGRYTVADLRVAS